MGSKSKRRVTRQRKKQKKQRAVASRNIHQADGSKKLPMSPGVRAIIEYQLKRFEEKFGRPPGPHDPIFFDPDADTPTRISEEKLARWQEEDARVMEEIGIDPSLIHAHKKTGLMVTNANKHLLSADDIEEWNAAITEYRRAHPEMYAPEDIETELDMTPVSAAERAAWDRCLTEGDSPVAALARQYIAEDAATPATRCAGCARPLDPTESTTSRLCWICENKRMRKKNKSAAAPSNPYAGESDAKRIARYDLYAHLQGVIQTYGDPGGWAVVLAGPDAAEVGVLRYVLGWPRDRVIFVDKDETGLRAAEQKWPGVDTFHGDIIDILTALRGGIGFAHFDFMGHVNKTVQETFEIARGKIQMGGVIAYTYLRGREHAKTPNWQEALAAGKSMLLQGRKLSERRRLRRDQKTLMEAARVYGYMALLAAALSPRGFDEYAPLYTGRYHSGRSPMGFFALARRPVQARGLNWPEPVDNDMPADDYGDRLKRVIVDFRQMGYPDNEIAAVFNVDARSLPAWQAHVTRGTYN